MRAAAAARHSAGTCVTRPVSTGDLHSKCCWEVKEISPTWWGPDQAKVAQGRLSSSSTPCLPLFSDLQEPQNFPGPRFLPPGEKTLDQLLGPEAAYVSQLPVKRGQGVCGAEPREWVPGQNGRHQAWGLGSREAVLVWDSHLLSCMCSSFSFSIPFLTVISRPQTPPRIRQRNARRNQQEMALLQSAGLTILGETSIHLSSPPSTQ